MSGIEAAGIALAGASITFQILAGCFSGFDTLSGLSGSNNDARTAQLMLRLEEYRLTQWSARSGAANDALDRTLNVQVVNTTLSQIRSLLTDTNAMSSTYGLTRFDGLSPPSSSIVKPLTQSWFTSTAALRSRVRVDQNQPLPLRKQVLWVLRDRAKFGVLLDTVRHLNDVLFELLSNVDREHLNSDLRFMNLQIVNLADKVDEVRSVQQVMEITTGPQSEECSCAAMKSLRLEMERYSSLTEGDAATNDYTLPENIDLIPQLRRQLCSNLPSNSNRGLARYSGKLVFVEWKPIIDNASDALALHLDTRVVTLATLLSKSKATTFRTLTCRGYFEDVNSCGYYYVYEHPMPPPDADSSLSTKQPASLLELFHDNDFKPSLSERVKLAQTLATTILHLHTTEWLHKGIRSDNIVFFHDKIRGFDITSPYLIGFEYARFDATNQFSEKPPENPEHDIYRHPSAHSGAAATFRKAFDVYALGLVFLEIGKWRPLKHIAKGLIDYRRCSLNDVLLLRDALVGGAAGRSGIMRDLEFRAGTIFAEVTRQCLSFCQRVGEFQQDEVRDPQEIQAAFVDHVVKPLFRCTI